MDLVARYVEAALEAQEAGEEIDLEALCAAHPEVIPEVRALLDLDARLDFRVPADPLLGDVLNERYELRECIGAGAMGVVYRGFDRTLGREVAVKILQQGIFSSDLRRQRFEREARVLAAIDHPHVVRIFDQGRSERGLQFIVMELLAGVSLATVLHQAQTEREEARAAGAAGPRFDGAWLRERFDIEVASPDFVPQIITWCAQVAAALAVAHEQGVIHRDVKPSNVMIRADGEAVLLDFGIAVQSGDASLTAAGSTIGTPWYMAPEQALDAEEANELVDVYGLAATLYHLATMRPPYEGDYGEVLVKLRSADPVPPGRLRKELSRDLCAVIEKGMERSVARRYASASELAADLVALRGQMPVTARPISGPQRFLRRVRRRPGPVLAVGAMVLVAGAAVWITSVVQDGQATRRLERRERYLDLVAGLPVSLGTEGRPQDRPNYPAEERRASLRQLDEILTLRPEDAYHRLLRFALRQDMGDQAACVADLRTLLEGLETSYAQTVLQRYADVDPGHAGANALDLDALPPPTTVRGRLVHAFQLVRMKRYFDANMLLAEAGDDWASIYLRLGALSHLAGRYPRGSEAGTDAAEEVRRLVAKAVAALGRPTARTHYMLGRCWSRIEDHARAATAYEAARRLSPDCFGCVYNLGHARRRTGEYQEAMRWFRKALALRPWNCNATLELARTISLRGDPEEAMTLARSMPLDGYLTKPWHRDYVCSQIQLDLSQLAWSEGKPEASRTAAARSVEFLEASLPHAAQDAYGRRLITGRLEIHRAALSGDPESRFELFIEQLLRDPLHPRLLAAAAGLLQRNLGGTNTSAALAPYFERLSTLSAAGSLRLGQTAQQPLNLDKHP